MVVFFFLRDHINLSQINPLYTTTGRKLNIHKTFRKRPGRLLNVLCTFSLRPVSTGIMMVRHGQKKLMCCNVSDLFSYEHWTTESLQAIFSIIERTLHPKWYRNCVCKRSMETEMLIV